MHRSEICVVAAKLDKKGSTKDIAFTRRYLDPNRVTYEVCLLSHVDACVCLKFVVVVSCWNWEHDIRHIVRVLDHEGIERAREEIRLELPVRHRAAGFHPHSVRA